MNTQASISPEAARIAAIAGLPGQIVSIDMSDELSILPGQNRYSPEHHLVYSMEVRTLSSTGIPARYYTLVDAHSGEIIYRSNRVMHSDNEKKHSDPKVAFYLGISQLPLEVSATVSGSYYLTNPWDNPITGVLSNVFLSVSGTTYQTDANGLATMPVNPGSTATVALRGPWARVYSSGVTPQASFTLASGANNISFNSASTIKERTAYQSVQRIHQHVKTWLPSFTGMDFQLPTNIDVSGECNAFYDGSSINFYAIGGGCNPTSLIPDVAFHEYGHGINDKYYQSLGGSFNNSSMNEGYADFWAISLSGNPALGTGFYTDNLDPIRRYDADPKVYPMDLSGEFHNDGEIIMGAWWDTHLLMGNDWNITMPLFAETYAGMQAIALNGNEGQAFTDVLIDLLQADDNDGNLTNGTPHSSEIIEGFYIHGITLLSNASLFHVDVEFADAETDIPLSAFLNLQSPFLPFLQGVQCRYRINSGEWQSLVMENSGGSGYTLNFPGQPSGTVISYYLCTVDINNTLSNVQPKGAHQSPYPNLPYFIIVGAEQQAIQDCDENEDWGAWQTGVSGDNASTGKWDLEIPIPSITTDEAAGTVVQTGTQTTPEGEYCFVTGNASSSSAPIGESDVDDGKTTLQSPIIDMSSYSNPIISYMRWYTNSPPGGANPGMDWWQVQMSNNGGQSWTYIENNSTSDPSWRRNVFRVADYLEPTSQMRFRFIASDSVHLGEYLDGGSLVEAAMDDFTLYDAEHVSVEEKDMTGMEVFYAYPNPASQRVSFDFSLSEPGNVEFALFNMIGQKVYSVSWGRMGTGRHTKTAELPDLAQGNYSAQILSGSRVIVGKLVIGR
ncbi:MAG: T9SS type A sorting domain-containing protein [Crocinitomicaceae bacterium]|nr:T9SS type A sorting domain-containing protein [Crocinitomicaceae bacterium]